MIQIGDVHQRITNTLTRWHLLRTLPRGVDHGDDVMIIEELAQVLTAFGRRGRHPSEFRDTSIRPMLFQDTVGEPREELRVVFGRDVGQQSCTGPLFVCCYAQVHILEVHAVLNGQQLERRRLTTELAGSVLEGRELLVLANAERHFVPLDVIVSLAAEKVVGQATEDPDNPKGIACQHNVQSLIAHGNGTIPEGIHG